MHRQRAFDVVIAGGGAMGSSAAYWLKTLHPSLSVAVVERDHTYKRASSSLSVGSYRQQFSLPENIQLSMQSSQFLRHELPTALRLKGDGGDDEPLASISLVEAGYLLLASNSGEEGERVMRENHAVQVAEGARVQLLSAHGDSGDGASSPLAKRFPWISCDGLSLGSHGTANEGWFDPYALVQCFRRKAIELGVTYVGGEVCGFDKSPCGSKITTVRLASSSSIACGTVIHTTGPWAAHTAALAGVDNFPVRPRKRDVFQFHCPAARDFHTPFPLTVDPTGMYFRSDGPAHNFLCGMSPEPDEDWQEEDGALMADEALFYDKLWPLLANRVPIFAELKLKSFWAGLYEYNTLDQNAIIGPHPVVRNLLFANGFSGHGVQQSPCVGRALAELVVFGEYRTIDLRRLGYDRIARGEPLLERCIV